MATEETYREAHRRNHKVLGTYLALWGWTHCVDCVCLLREQLLPYLDLKKMQQQRIDWVKADVKALFPHSFATVDSKTQVYATLYLSRRPLPPEVQSGEMSDHERVRAFTDAGVPTAMVNIPKEADMVCILATLTHGIGEIPN